MRAGAYIVLAAVAIGVFVVLYFAIKPDPVVIEPAGHAREVPTLPPLIPDPHHVVAADSAGQKTKLPVQDADDVAVAVTIEADACTAERDSCTDESQNEPVRLLIDTPRPRWFPELTLVRSPIRIRTVDPGQAARVTAVHQRLPIVALEIQPVLGPGFREHLTGVAGATLLRLWILHLGGGIEYRSLERDVSPVGLALVQVRDHLYAGPYVTLEKGVGVVVAYGF